MKDLRFQELLLLSESEKTARAVLFDKNVTVIKGINDRGKSCLLKSIYMALGATPKTVHPRWAGLNVTLHLFFSVDSVKYSMLRSSKRFSLFDGFGKLIRRFTSVTADLAPFFGELLNFHLPLTSSTNDRIEQATPAILFLPYYFDQDSSWVDSWNGFEGTKQFKSPRKAAAEFHTGLKPNGYYQALAKKLAAEEERETVRHDRSVVNRVLDKIETLMRDAQFDMDIGSYQNEIDALLVKCNELRADEEKLKEEIVQFDNRRRSLERQIHITNAAAEELKQDFDFSSDELGNDVECPTCGARYENEFAERFGIASDEDELRVALGRMKDDLATCEREMTSRRVLTSETQERISEINELLETRQGEVKLNDLLRSEGKKEVRVVLRGELNELNRQIGSWDGEVEDAVGEMGEFTDKNRVKEIKDFYRQQMSANLEVLDVTGLEESTYQQVDCVIKESGSDKPRALLAFYFAILATIKKYSTATFCPVVIDSARQQEQDSDHWVSMLKFMRDARPSNCQMIIGLVDDMGIDLGGKVIELADERQLLQAGEYEVVARRLRPYIDLSLKG